MSHTNRIIVLVDMDCFYCQVEEKLDPNLAEKPIAVVQYNAWRGGGIIAVNYPAREKGVTRHMRGDEAKQKCPDIILARVPEIRGKADLTKYREAGKEVAEVLKTFTPLLERASVDEAYLDITYVVDRRMGTDFEQVNAENLKNSYVVGWQIEDFLHNIHQNREYAESNCKLAMGGLIAEEIRAEIFRITGYKCSAGIAHNKILAKVVCGLHKPNKQTLLPQESVGELYKDLPLTKVKSLGGKFGNALSQELNIKTMADLSKYSEKELAARYDKKTAIWLHNIARGIDLEPVSVRLVSKSIGCCKKFPGRSALVTPESVTHWMNELAAEITERLEKDLEENNRKAKQMVISFSQERNGNDIGSSRTIPLTSYDQNKIAQSGLDTLNKFCLRSDGTYNIKFLGISVGNFTDNKKGMNITSFFKSMNDVSKLENSKPITKNMELEQHKIVETSTSCTFVQEVQKESDYFLEEASGGDTNCDDGNTSVYSAITEDLNEDTKSLIYYEDIYPESVASQTSSEKKYTNENLKHDENLIFQGISDRNAKIVEQSSHSFFTKYFEKSENNSSNISGRHFDTSKILEGLDDSDESDTTNEEKFELRPVVILERSLILTSETRRDEITKKHDEEKVITETVKSDLKHTCVECQKKVHPWELQSHMDYHYALKIVRSESHLYKSTHSVLPKDSLEKEIPKKGIKRKTVSDVKESKPILTFLRKEDLNDENSIVCNECDKKINLEEMVSHADYHAAKKLHQEINSYSSTVNKTRTEKTSGKPKNKKKCDATIKKLDFFLKPS